MSRAVTRKGSLVDGSRIVTCAHVLPDGPETSELWVDFPQLPGEHGCGAAVVPTLWRGVGEGDMAVLTIESVPADVTPLHVRPSIPGPGWGLSSFGFPAEGPATGQHGSAETDGAIREGTQNLLQLRRASTISQGFSGAPPTVIPGLEPTPPSVEPAFGEPVKPTKIKVAAPSRVPPLFLRTESP